MKGNLQAKLNVAREKAAKRSVRLEGGPESGTFSGLISGAYQIFEGIATVTITKKPFFISWETVEAQLRQFLGG
jgi:hypothetical protein